MMRPSTTRFSVVAVAVTVVALAAVFSSPAHAAKPTSHPPYMGLSSLSQPHVHESGLRASLNASESFGAEKRLAYSYDAAHAEDKLIVKLAEVEGLDSVECHEQSLKLAFSSSSAAAAFYATLEQGPASSSEEDSEGSWAGGALNGVVVSGGAEWKCLKRSIRSLQAKHPGYQPPSFVSHHGVILRKASASALAQTLHREDDITIVFATEEAGYHDVFQDLKVRFRTSAFPQNAFHQYNHHHDGAQEEGRDRMQVRHATHTNIRLAYAWHTHVAHTSHTRCTRLAHT